MPKKRLPENRGLPPRWQLTHGAYYYQVPPGMEEYWDGKKKFRLGKTLTEAHRAWAERIEAKNDVRTIGQLLDRYEREVIPTKKQATQNANVPAIVNLRKVFGTMPLAAMKPMLVYRYRDLRSAKKQNAEGRTVGGLVAAHREIDVLSNAFTKAVEWGYIDRHPFLGQIRLTGEKPRQRYVKDWEVAECLKLDSKRSKGSVAAIQAYIRLKIVTGMDRKTLLTLTMSDIREDGIHIGRSKVEHSSGKETTYEMTDELREIIDLAKSARPKISPYLFCNRRGEGYYNEKTARANGWDSMWQRFMDRVLTETKVSERFTDHDLRAKAGSDAATLDDARALLSHASTTTTQRVYRRKAEKVKPLPALKKAAE